MRKVRASQDRITANSSRRRLQGKCNRKKPPRFFGVRMERRGKSSPAHVRACGHVNPIRCNTDWDGFAGPAVPKGGSERTGRPGAKIDCGTRQNSAYRLSRSFYKKRPYPRLNRGYGLLALVWDAFFCGFPVRRKEGFLSWLWRGGSCTLHNPHAGDTAQACTDNCLSVRRHSCRCYPPDRSEGLFRYLEKPYGVCFD